MIIFSCQIEVNHTLMVYNLKSWQDGATIFIIHLPNILVKPQPRHAIAYLLLFQGGLELSNCQSNTLLSLPPGSAFPI